MLVELCSPMLPKHEAAIRAKCTNHPLPWCWVRLTLIIKNIIIIFI